MGNLARWIRIRTTHQTLKCGTQTLTRTPAQGNLLRDRKKSGYRWATFVFTQFGHIARQCRVQGENLHISTTETLSFKGRQSGASQQQRKDLGIIWLRLWRQLYIWEINREDNFTCHEEHWILRDSAIVLHHAEIDPWLRRWTIWSKQDRLGSNSMDEKYLHTRTCYQVFDSKSKRLVMVGAVSWRQNCRISQICTILDEENWMVHTTFSLSWAGQCWRRTSRVRVQDFHKEHYAEVPPGSPNTDGEKDHVQPEDLKDRIIFMSMYNDIHWCQKGNQESCKRNFSDVAEHAEKFPRRHWSFLGPGSEEKWYARP